MSLQLQMREDMKTALKARDEVKLRTVRAVITGITNELVATGHKPQDELNDEGVLSVIKKQAKQRKDSIEQYTSAGRDDLAEPEKAELAVLESYLPALMTQDAIRPIAEAKKAELSIEDKAKMGILIGAVMKETAGQADGGDVKAVVESLF